MIHSDSTPHVESPQPPVHRLSYDDLHLIFSLCWEPSDETFPIVLSHVCRRWRSFILDMPSFWGHVRFHQKDPRLSLERYSTWVQRSKDVRLDISINDKPFVGSTAENIEAIMELVGPHVERWKSLQIDQVSLQDIRMFLGHLEERSLPQLKILRIMEFNEGIRHPDEPESLEQFVLHATRLKGLELVGVVPDFDSPLFHNLHALYLKDEYFSRLTSTAAKDMIYKLLQQSPYLKRLHIRNPRSPPPRKSSSPPIANEEQLFSHPSLVDLILDHPRAVYDAIIPSARFPALRSFRSAHKSELTLSSWHLPLLARNSPFPSLKQISLSGHPTHLQHDRYLADALATLASLERLKLAQFDLSLAVNALPTLGYSCPQLKVLVLHWCNRLDIDQVRSLVDTRLRDDEMTGLVELGIYGGIGDAFPEWDATEKWLKERVKSVTLFTNADLM